MKYAKVYAEDVDVGQSLPDSFDMDDMAAAPPDLAGHVAEQIALAFSDRVGLEIARALHFFFSSTAYNHVSQIVLSGGCAAIPGVDAAIVPLDV